MTFEEKLHKEFDWMAAKHIDTDKIVADVIRICHQEIDEACKKAKIEENKYWIDYKNKNWTNQIHIRSLQNRIKKLFKSPVMPKYADLEEKYIEGNQVEAQVIKPTRNNGFCGDCYFFELYGGEYDLTERCKLLKVEELKFNDWFIAECNNDEAL